MTTNPKAGIDVDEMARTGGGMYAVDLATANEMAALLKEAGFATQIRKEGNNYRVYPSKMGTVQPKRRMVEKFEQREDARRRAEELAAEGKSDYEIKPSLGGGWEVSESTRKTPEFGTKEEAEERQTELKRMGVRTKIKPTIEGAYRLTEPEINTFDTKKDAEAYVARMARRNIRLKIVGTEEGTWQAVKLSASEFLTEEEAKAQQPKLSFRSKTKQLPDGTWTLERMSDTEFSNYAQAQARQKELEQSGIRTKTKATASGTIEVVKLGDNEFASRDEAIQRQRQLEKRGIISDRDIKFDAASGTYSLTGVKQATMPVTSGTIEKGIEAARVTRIAAAPKIASWVKRSEETKERMVAQAQRFQERAKPAGEYDKIADKIIKRETLTPEEEQFRVNNREAIENLLQYRQQTGYKPETKMRGLQRKTIGVVGKVEEKAAPVIAKAKQVGIKTFEVSGQVAAGGIASYVSAQQAVVPTITKFGKAAVAEFAPTQALRKGQAAKKMVEAGVPAAPGGEKTAFGQHGERYYKITDTGKVPRIAAKSVSRGSNVGEKVPRIGEIGSVEEAPGEKLLMSKVKPLKNMETSGTVDFSER